jgi:SSS family solute:Na+ symporter
VWTYDLYQAHLNPGASDGHYLHVGRIATVAGIAASIGAAYFTAQFNNIMDVLQLVFAFVNAPLLATFLLGMFWRRTTGHGAFYGLVLGTVVAALHHGLTLPANSTMGVKGGWTGHALHLYASEMAQNFWTAIFAWVACFGATVAISLCTSSGKTDSELGGLVYNLTPKQKEQGVPWFAQPAALGLLALGATILLNLYFW